MASKPLTIPNVFASEGTGTPNNIPLLDADFTQVANYFNDGSFFSTRGIDTGAANAYVVTLPSGYVPSAYNVGMRLVFNPGNSNTGASTINVNALGTQTILTANGSALAGSEITAGYDCDLVYDGTNFRVLSLAIPQITSVRLRSFSAVGNPGFEVDQINVNALVSNIASNIKICDRWVFQKGGSVTGTVNAAAANTQATNVPGTSFCITNSALYLQVGTSQASLGASDYVMSVQNVEGNYWRELSHDVTSISLMVNSGVAPLKFSVALRSPDVTRSITKLCTVTTPNSWQLIQLPNIPVPSGGNFSILPGSAGYAISICLAAGSTLTAPANDVWQNGNFVGAVGMDNWLSKPSASNFYVGFVQHEPGPLCTTLQDKPFTQNYDECLRYFQKTYPYANAAGSVVGGWVFFPVFAGNQPYTNIPFKKTMAKTPTVTGYSDATGAVNNVRDFTAGVDRVISGASRPFDSGFGGFSCTSTNASNAYFSLHYTADTGW